MSLHLDIKNSIKKAMIEKDQLRLGVFRGLVTDFTNELVSKKRKPDEILSDEDALSVIKRAAKRRMDSVEQFRSGGRDDLARSEEEELGILKTFIPEGINKEDIKKIVLTKKNELNITDKTKSGLLMSAVMKELKGKADGSDVKEVVEELLN